MSDIDTQYVWEEPPQRWLSKTQIEHCRKMKNSINDIRNMVELGYPIPIVLIGRAEDIGISSDLLVYPVGAPVVEVEENLFG